MEAPYNTTTQYVIESKGKTSQVSPHDEKNHRELKNDSSEVKMAPTQHSLSHDLEDIQLDYVLKHAGSEDNITLQARLRSMSAKYAGGWLRVIPSKSLSLDFKSQEFLIVLKWWMGIPLVPTGKMFDCNKCGAIIDASGYHALTCKAGGNLIHRHNSIRDTIGKACQMAG